LQGIQSLDLINAAIDLSCRYRNQTHQKFMISKLHHLAYLVTRLPATYAVNYEVLKLLSLSHFRIKSFLDLGAGPGTGMWAAADLWPELDKISLIEIDSNLIRLGQQLSQSSLFLSVQKATWQKANLTTLGSLIPHDVLSLSYVLGELDQLSQAHLLKLAWQATQKALVLIEPGTPVGFNYIREARTWLIQNGATIFAPCPHNTACPLQEQDWCHFSVRLPRSKIHRHLKKAVLGYEDEKYSYIIACKTEEHQSKARIIRKPITIKGQVILDLCTLEKTQRINISKKSKSAYLQARKVKWGDSWNFTA
jgi:ribosomal protein RSM22 (predicted rRNA methylase)